MVVANHQSAWEFHIDLSVPKAELVSETKGTEPEKRPDVLGSILKELREKQKERRLAVQTFQGPSSAVPEWAEFSPDCRLVVVGLEDPAVNVQRNISYGHPKPWSEVGRMSFNGDHFIEDVAWSRDSRFLVVVETEERYSKSLRGVLSAISGHPIPLNSLYLTSVEASSGKRERLKLLSDIPYGTSIIYGSRTACPEQ